MVYDFLPKSFCRRPSTVSVTLLGAALFLVATLFGSAQPASAQQGFGNFFGYSTQSATKRRARSRRVRRSRSRKAASEDTKQAEKKTAGPVYAVISLGSQHITVYDANGRIAQSRVSTGMRGLRTPEGVFSVIQRHRHHYSNLYGGAAMPYMQRITWSGVAMHAGHVPGYPASHGCIRLVPSFASRMWGLTEMGSRVIVSPSDTTPSEITHSLLPTTTRYPAPPPPPLPVPRREAVANTSPVQLASADEESSIALMAETGQPDATENTSSSDTLNPIEYAAYLQQRATAEKAMAEQAAKEALKNANEAAAEARKSVEDLKKAEANYEDAEAKLDKLEATPTVVKTSDEEANETLEAAEAAKSAAEAELKQARSDLDEARAREAVKTPAAFAAVEDWKKAVTRSKDAAKLLKEAERRQEPVSIFVSKKEGRIFIRQDWKEVYEAPVTIRYPDRPLGTHVYIAVAPQPDQTAMRWSAITMPEKSTSNSTRTKKTKNSKKKDKVEQSAVSSTQAETAAGALGRIELPPEARERIEKLLWTGASLIVSDHGRSHEMGDYTDFIVLTR